MDKTLLTVVTDHLIFEIANVVILEKQQIT